MSKIGITLGTFDFLHAGHVAMLKQCKEHCDYLIVGLQVNPNIERTHKHKPIETVLERQIKLEGCKYVDEVIVYESDSEIETLIHYFNVSIRFIGTDYINKQEDIMSGDLVPIHFTTWIPPTSSEIRERIKNDN